jgi:hypothetical protein
MMDDIEILRSFRNRAASPDPVARQVARDRLRQLIASQTPMAVRSKRPSKRRPINGLPQPVVLVIRDESSYFSSEVWSGVVEAARETTRNPHQISWFELEPMLASEYGEVQSRLRRLGVGRMRRPATRAPVPLQLTHGHDPDITFLRDDLRRLLDLFDVWGVIASGSARQTEPVRNILQGIDVPLLVTTDSTTVDKSVRMPNELRLMPSNQAQATAMLFAATRAAKGYRSTPNGPSDQVLLGIPEVAYSCDDMPHSRRYVSDLRHHLLSEAARLGISIRPFDEREDHRGPLIVIGYAAHASNIIARRSEGWLTILSDGCATQPVYDEVVRRRVSDARFWLVTRPEVKLATLGSKSFAAIAEAGHKLLMWDVRNLSEVDLPAISRRDLIKQILQETDDIDFSFAGIENIAPAYRVAPIVNERDLLRAKSPSSLRDDSRNGLSHRLTLVSKE